MGIVHSCTNALQSSMQYNQHACLQPNTRWYAAGELIDITYYKAFDNTELISSTGFKYKLGETFTIDASPSLCTRGFHACKNPLNCLTYVFCIDLYEVHILGTAVSDGEKIATNKIKIVRQVPYEERRRLLPKSHSQWRRWL
jgi:hypothetical protein